MNGTQFRVLYPVIILIALGVVAVYSASAIRMSVPTDPNVLPDPTRFLRKQGMWSLLSILALILTWHTDYRTLCRNVHWLMGGAVLLLLLVLVPGIGKAAGNARRWLELGPLRFQPSELAKLALIVWLAVYSAARKDVIHRFKEGLLPALAMIGFLMVLVVAEPDLGTALFIGLLGFLLLVIAGAKVGQLVPLGAAVVLPIAVIAALNFKHIQPRLTAFLNPEANPDSAYQLLQSLIALGSGGPYGAGPGEGMQKAFYLPAEHNDFILASIGEELGFLGTFAVVLLFIAFIRGGLRVCRQAPDLEGVVIAAGITALIAFQALLNVAVVTGAVPTKGISLPFLSSGGSGLLIAAASVGVLLNIAGCAESESLPLPLPDSSPSAAPSGGAA